MVRIYTLETTGEGTSLIIEFTPQDLFTLSIIIIVGVGFVLGYLIKKYEVFSKIKEIPERIR